MYAALLTLSLLFTTNPAPSGVVTVNIDGYIEINHFWNEDDGKLVFDQLLIWQYNAAYGSYDCIHWEMITDAREDKHKDFYHFRDLFLGILTWWPDSQEKTRFVWTMSNVAVEQYRSALAEEIATTKKLLQIQNYKKLNVKVEEVVVYIAPRWIQPKTVGRVEYDPRTNTYSTSMKIQDGSIVKFVVGSVCDTNTLSDPEQDYKQRIYREFGFMPKNKFSHIKSVATARQEREQRWLEAMKPKEITE